MSRKKTIWLWIFSIIFTLFIAVFQRMTGPTYPVKGKVTLNGNEIKFTLPTTSDAEEGELIKVEVPDTSVKGEFSYQRFNRKDTIIIMRRDGEYLAAIVPKQPTAGIIRYNIKLMTRSEKVSLSDNFIKLRYKGKVPDSVLIIHIIIIFLAMLYSTRAGVEAMYKGVRTYRYAFVTLVTLLIGGLILGPVVQKYAFGAYWTGWPFGHDLTDNKTVIAFIFWIIAFFKLARNRKNYKWTIIAAVILLVVFLIPHSILGSEIDYTAK